MSYTEIEDIKEVEQLNKKLSQKMRNGMRIREERKIGYPGGHEYHQAFFSSRAPESLWWPGWQHDSGNFVNLIGRGTVGEHKTTLFIDVQLNLPTGEYHRRSGGAFLKNDQTGAIILAHRGIATLGHGRVPKAKLFDALGARVYEASTSKGLNEFLLVCELESSTLLNEIEDFAVSLRTAVREMRNEADEQKNIDRRKSERKAKHDGFSKLRDYLKEFAGKRRGFRPKSVVADVHHGAVVNELDRSLKQGKFKTLNSVEIDLIAEGKKRVALFEVKTSSSTQSIYTAIGQLTVHRANIQELFPSKPIDQFLITPEPPMSALKDIVENELGITIVCYKRSEHGIISFPNFRPSHIESL
jgi:hypothetical protein